MRFLNPEDSLPSGTLVLANSDDVVKLAPALQGATAVALQFPRWVDGRAYSQAVVLRGRLRYSGELIATGEVVVDMLTLLRRCGFDAVQLMPGQSLEDADRSLGFFSAHYQPDPGRSLRA